MKAAALAAPAGEKVLREEEKRAEERGKKEGERRRLLRVAVHKQDVA